jgi:hypothetical protein
VRLALYVVYKVGKWLGKEGRKEGMHAMRVHEARPSKS